MSENIENSLLAHWRYNTVLWQRFSSVQAKQKKIENIIFSLVILVFGMLILMLVKRAPFFIALIFTLPFAILFPLVRFKKSQKYFKQKTQNPEIKIYTNHLEINGVKKQLVSKKYWLLDVNTKPIGGLDVLCFDVAWSANKGRSNDEFRIPIPPKAVVKAKEIVDFFKNK